MWCPSFFYNIFGMLTNQALSAVLRTMLEGSRVAFIWVGGLALHYYLLPKSSYGEELHPYSWLELVGFVLLLIGQLIYSEVLQLPGFEYLALPPSSPVRPFSPGKGAFSPGMLPSSPIFQTKGRFFASPKMPPTLAEVASSPFLKVASPKLNFDWAADFAAAVEFQKGESVNIDELKL
mmetsp:Transcript_4314/g.9578  ORF Transcript_4314/g.9578 Transcript_4314/m.9578 type:complete len:178 (+) Transcript_4314:868-1401(+)